VTNNLFFEERGNADNPKIVFLHGLLGSSRNWRSITKIVSEEFHTLSFDLPGHGKSPHLGVCTVETIAECISSNLRRRGVESFSICGHSLGGKVAMRIACDLPAAIEKLAIVDIAPRDYPPEHHLPTLTALLELNIAKISNRKEADLILSEQIPNWAFRQFLLTNLEVKEGILAWLPDLKGLKNSIQFLSSNPLKDGERYEGASLFIRGGKSGYVRSEHVEEIHTFFPQSKIKTLPQAGHDVHVEDREGFLSLFQDFLNE
jgi:esterase